MASDLAVSQGVIIRGVSLPVHQISSKKERKGVALIITDSYKKHLCFQFVACCALLWCLHGELPKRSPVSQAVCVVTWCHVLECCSWKCMKLTKSYYFLCTRGFPLDWAAIKIVHHYSPTVQNPRPGAKLKQVEFKDYGDVLNINEGEFHSKY